MSSIVEEEDYIITILLYYITGTVQGHIKFNPQKSQAATFGGNSPPVSVKLCDAALGWVSSVKYLGCYFLSRSCTVDTTRCVGKFYGSFKYILNVLGKRRNDMLVVHLIKAYCLPMLLYSCEIWRARPVL